MKPFETQLRMRLKRFRCLKQLLYVTIHGWVVNNCYIETKIRTDTV